MPLLATDESDDSSELNESISSSLYFYYFSVIKFCVFLALGRYLKIFPWL